MDFKDQVLLEKKGQISADFPLGIDYLLDTSFHFDAPVENGFKVQVDTDSRLIKTSITSEITSEVTTFNL